MTLLKILCLAALVVPGPETVPAADQASLLLKALAYSKSLPTKVGRDVTVVVLYRFKDKSSEAARDAIVPQLATAAQRQTVNGLPIKVVALPYNDAEDLEIMLLEMGTDALYICPALAAVIGEITPVARRKSVLTVTGEETLVRTSGVSMSFVSQSGKSVLLVNLQAAAAEGANFDSALLSFAEVLR